MSRFARTQAQSLGRPSPTETASPEERALQQLEERRQDQKLLETWRRERAQRAHRRELPSLDQQNSTMPRRPKTNLSSFHSGLLTNKRVKSSQWPVFYEGLATLFGAGISIDQALLLLGERVDDPILSQLCSRLHRKVISGVSLTKALEDESQHIPEFQRRLIRAGEVSGRLNLILKQLARHEAEQHRLKSKLQSMLTYPTLLISATVVGILLVSHHLAAPILATLDSAGQSLPWFLTPVFALSAAANSLWFWLGVAACVGLVWRFLDRQTLKGIFWSVAFSLPGLRAILSRVAEERFARAFALLLAAGLRVDQAVTCALEVTANPRFTRQVRPIVSSIENGATLSQALKEAALFSPTFLSMVEVGEESGRVPELAGRAANFHAQSLDADLQAAVNAAEPILLMGTGLLVGVFVLSMMMPLSQAIQTLG